MGPIFWKDGKTWENNANIMYGRFEAFSRTMNGALFGLVSYNKP